MYYYTPEEYNIYQVFNTRVISGKKIDFELIHIHQKQYNRGPSINYVRTKGEGGGVKPPMHFYCV